MALGRAVRRTAPTTTQRPLCWDARRNLLADTPAKLTFSQHGNAFAVLSGAVTGAAARDLMVRVAADPTLAQASLYFRFYLNRARKQAGLGDTYLDGLGPWKEAIVLPKTVRLRV